MSQLTLKEKLGLLRSRHTGSHQEAKSQIRDWEDRISLLQVQDDWLQHPTTKELKRCAEERIVEIDQLLCTDKNANRDYLFAEKDAHLIYLAIFPVDPNGELERIEKVVDSEL